jgi:hypothetical protein
VATFKSYTDRAGDKVKIGDLVVVMYKDNEINKTGKVATITNEKFNSISVILDGNPYEYISAKNTRKEGKM